MKFSDIVEYAKQNPKEIRVSNHGKFSVLKYTKRSVFDKIWNPYTRECRGLVWDNERNEIVAYPFSKFFNEFEEFSDKFSDDEIVYAVKKVNGFLSIITVHHGELIINTSGSMNSEYVKMVEHFVDKERFLSVLDERYTYMFECVSPIDYHVTDETVGLTLLGFREKRLGSPIHFRQEELLLIAMGLNCNINVGKMMRYKDVKMLQHTDKGIEGYVVYSPDGTRAVKMKTKDFLEKRKLAYVMDKKLTSLTIDDFDEETRDIGQYIVENCSEVCKMTHPERVMLVKHFCSERPICYLTVGIPYSGKSTYIANHKFLSNLPCVSFDAELEKHASMHNISYTESFEKFKDVANKTCNSMLNQLIDERQSFVVDKTNLTQKRRTALVSTLKKRGYRVVAIQFEVPSKELLDERKKIRVNKPISDDVIFCMIEKYNKINPKDEKFDMIVSIEQQKMKNLI